MAISASIAAWLKIQDATSTRIIAAIDLPHDNRFRLIQTFGS
jgi:hypothetical protein